MHEACIAGEMAQGGLNVLLVFIPDRVGAIPTRHHLLRWGRGAHKETTCLFAEWWVLSEYNSFEHFPYVLECN